MCLFPLFALWLKDYRLLVMLPIVNISCARQLFIAAANSNDIIKQYIEQYDFKYTVAHY